MTTDRLEHEVERELHGEAPERGAEEQIAPEASSDPSVERAQRVEAIAPLYDRVEASGFLGSIFGGIHTMQARSVGDVLRAQYVKLAAIIRELEGQVTNLSFVEQNGTSPDDDRYQEGYDAGFSQGFATAQAERGPRA